MHPELTIEQKLDIACVEHIKRYGVEPQLIVAMEESGELIQAISKFYRFRNNAIAGHMKQRYMLENLIGECVDVSIMIRQIQTIIDEPKLWSRIYASKVNRAYQRIEGETKDVSET